MYIKLTDSVPAPYSVAQLRRDNPDMSFPAELPDDLLARFDVFPVSHGEVPEFDPLTQRIVEGSPEEIEGQGWVIPYTTEPLADDQAAIAVRGRRDMLLSECDWVVALAYERGEAVSPEWAAYRQALRDIPQQAGFPHDVMWPTTL